MTRFILLLAFLLPYPAVAQDMGQSEIVVSALRREADGYDERVPAIGLKRQADFAIQEVIVACDTRDASKRHTEIFAMIKGAIDLAGKNRSIALATGEMIVEPLTLANYHNLQLLSDGRPDSDRASFLVKAPLGKGVDAKSALASIDAFIKNVPSVGRAEIRRSGDLTLSVVSPDQYRGQIVDLVAADAHVMAGKLGTDYAVEIKGLDRPVEWSRASLTDVFLYVPYAYTIRPR